ncbi:MAG: ABC transporter ATP-binding protein [Bacteroides sp.]|nr:ABC transporter ATP-binding protein [Prevotella sp.]MCM1407980.1 ABC transporter ATP-binding protein [Treponema brennaborense]MCM1468956.1 ABC transporter ATP-binding protein [Bacteroides sp.]
MSILSCRDLEVRYGSYTAVKNVSISVNAGDYICIVGANGSGKSTLLKALLGLIPAYSGTIEQNPQAVGYLPQQTPAQRDFPASVQEIVLSGCIHSKSKLPFISKKDRETAQQKLELLHIESLKKKSYRNLSGGQQQRVLLARALCAAKQLLVLDEPAAGLDPTVTDELYEIIRALNKTEKTAVLMVSHDIHRALKNATHILHMNKSPAFYGTAEAYRQSAAFSVFAGMETCSTHQGFSCSPQCRATHIPYGENTND